MPTWARWSPSPAPNFSSSSPGTLRCVSVQNRFFLSVVTAEERDEGSVVINEEATLPAPAPPPGMAAEKRSEACAARLTFT